MDGGVQSGTVGAIVTSVVPVGGGTGAAVVGVLGAGLGTVDCRTVGFTEVLTCSEDVITELGAGVGDGAKVGSGVGANVEGSGVVVGGDEGESDVMTGVDGLGVETAALVDGGGGGVEVDVGSAVESGRLVGGNVVVAIVDERVVGDGVLKKAIRHLRHGTWTPVFTVLTAQA